jgi:hypothetical protein
MNLPLNRVHGRRFTRYVGKKPYALVLRSDGLGSPASGARSNDGKSIGSTEIAASAAAAGLSHSLIDEGRRVPLR